MPTVLHEARGNFPDILGRELFSSSVYHILPFGMKSMQASGVKCKLFLDLLEGDIAPGQEFLSVLASVLYK